jgi:hypothetical protein
MCNAIRYAQDAAKNFELFVKLALEYSLTQLAPNQALPSIDSLPTWEADFATDFIDVVDDTLHN